MSEGRYHAFLSHHGADTPAVVELAERLQKEKEGITCWLDSWDLIPGEPWMPVVERALKECDCCCVFIGPNGMGPWQHEEIRAAIARRVKDTQFRVIPVVLPGGRREQRSHLPSFLVEHTWVEFHESLDEEIAFHRLTCGILGETPGPNATLESGQCPYPGLQTFQVEEAPLFFGRQVEVEWLLNKLRTNFNTPQENRFLAIVGASGSGKSSLARAGLLAAISQEQLPDSSHWPLIICRPGYDPLKQLALALWHHPQIKEAAGDYGELIERLANQPQRLHLTIDAALYGRPETHRAVLLIDQFEEIFTLCDNEDHRRALIDNLLESARVRGGRTLVVITLRADFYGRCGVFPRLAAALSDHQELVGPMQAKHLRQAIAHPAQLAGCELEPGLTEMLLEGMENQAGGLPLLQHALRQLWLRRSGRHLTVAAYREIGRLEGALDRYANELFEHLSDEQRSICRRIFLRLIQPGEGSEDTKRRAARTELGTDPPVDVVLNRLADARLITTSGDEPSGENFVDISHEALIRGWQRLGQWVNDNRESIRIQQRLTAAASEWQQHQRDEAYLYRGARLAEAEEWSQTEPAELTLLEKDFLEASTDARNQQRRREVRRTRLMTAVAVTAAVFAIIATVSYFNARTARNEAESAYLEGQKLLVRQYVGRGTQLSLQGDGTGALPWFARALKLDAGDPAKEHLHRVRLNTFLRNCYQPLQLLVHDDAVTQAKFNRDGSRVLTLCADGVARLWDSSSGTLIESLENGDPVYQTGFSGDGRHVLTISRKTARAWKSEDGTELVSRAPPEGGFLTAGAISHAGNLIAVADRKPRREGDQFDNAVQVWNLADSSSAAQRFKRDNEVRHLDFSPNGGLLAAASAGTLDIWELTGGSKILSSEVGAYRATFAQDSRRLVLTFESHVGVWDVTKNEWVGLVEHPQITNYDGKRDVWQGQLSGDHRMLVTSGRDGKARLWRLDGQEPGEMVAESVLQHQDQVRHADFSPDGRYVVTASLDHSARVWDVTSGLTVNLPMQHAGAVTQARFSPDGRTIVTASDDGVARIWFFPVGQLGVPTVWGQPADIPRAPWYVRQEIPAALHPNGRELVTLIGERTLLRADTETGAALKTLQADIDVECVSFTGDGLHLCLAGGAQAQVLDLESGQTIAGPFAITAPEPQETAPSEDPNPDTDEAPPQKQDEAEQSTNGKPRHTRRFSGFFDLMSVVRAVWFPGEMQAAVLSSDGKLLIAASQDQVSVISLPDGQTLAELWHKQVNKIVVHPDGRRLITAGGDGSARVWDWRSAELLVSRKHQQPLAMVKLDADARHAVTVSTDGHLQRWSVDTGKLVQGYVVGNAAIGSIFARMVQHGDISPLAFSPDASLLVTVDGDRHVQMWEVETGERLSGPLTHDAKILCAVFSPAGDLLATGDADGYARVWDTRTGKPTTPQLPHTARLTHGSDQPRAAVNDVSFSPDGRQLATASDNGSVQIWNPASGEALGEYPLGPVDGAEVTGQQFPVKQVAFYADGRRFVAWGHDGKYSTVQVRHQDEPSPKILGLSQLHDPPVGPAGQITFALGEGYVVFGGRREGAVWQVDTGEELLRIFVDSKRFALGLVASSSKAVRAFTPDVLHTCFRGDGRRVVTAHRGSYGHPEHCARIWDVESGALVTGPLLHKGPVWHAAFSGDGKFVVTASSDGTARVWDAVTGHARTPPLNHDGSVGFATFSPNGQYVVTTSDDRTARIWDAATGQPVGSALRHIGQYQRPERSQFRRPHFVRYAAFSPDSRYVATVSFDGTARIWEVLSGSPATPWLRHDASVGFATFSHDGRLLATCADDGTIRLWSAENGEPVAPLLRQPSVARDQSSDQTNSDTYVSRHRSEINAWSRLRCEFSRDDQHLLTSDIYGTASIWDLSPTEASVADLASWSELLAGRRIDDSGGFSLLTNDEVRQRSGALSRSRKPWATSLTRESTQAWLYREAYTCEATGNWFAAHFYLTQLIDNYDPAANLFIRRARCAVHMGDGGQAVDDCSKALESQEDSLQARRAPGTVDKADFPALEEDSFALRRLRGFAKLQLGQYAEALGDLKVAGGHRPDDHQVRLAQGYCHATLGNWSEAIAAYQEAIKQLNEKPKPLVHSPAPGAAPSELIGLGLPLMKVEGQAALLHAATGDQKAFASACGDLVRRYGDAEDKAAVPNALQWCILRPGLGSSFDPHDLIDLVTRLPHREPAEPERAAVEEDRPAHANLIGAVYYRVGLLSQAHEHLQQATKLADQKIDPRTWLFLALVLERLQQYEQARNAWAQAETLIGAFKNVNWHRRLAWALLSQEVSNSLRKDVPSGEDSDGPAVAPK